MEDAVVMTECDALEELVHKGFDSDVVECAAVPSGIHVFFEVLVHVLEYKHKLVFCMDHIIERHDVLMLQLLHQGDLADRGGGCSFLTV